MSEERGSAFVAQWSLSDSYPMYIAEFLGTLILSLTFGICTSSHLITVSTDDKTFKFDATAFAAPLAVGFIVVAMVYAFGHISGAHLNPAVTIAVWIRGFISPYDAFIFMSVQILGAISGAFLAWLITNECPYIEPGHDVGIGRAFVSEFIYTFAMCIVVINVATTESQRGNFFYGVAIGMTVSTGLASVQAISGAAFNPAIGTAFSITNVLRKGGAGTIKYIWIYWLAPILGGVCGGLSFYVINAKEYQAQQQNMGMDTVY